VKAEDAARKLHRAARAGITAREAIAAAQRMARAGLHLGGRRT